MVRLYEKYCFFSAVFTVVAVFNLDPLKSLRWKLTVSLFPHLHILMWRLIRASREDENDLNSLSGEKNTFILLMAPQQTCKFYTVATMTQLLGVEFLGIVFSDYCSTAGVLTYTRWVRNTNRQWCPASPKFPAAAGGSREHLLPVSTFWPSLGCVWDPQALWSDSLISRVCVELLVHRGLCRVWFRMKYVWMEVHVLYSNRKFIFKAGVGR